MLLMMIRMLEMKRKETDATIEVRGGVQLSLTFNQPRDAAWGAG
jgi:hypothetical protein